ncbi:bublin coiled-coil protein [Protopterus annectens]|uniref:bublin coiled-coil protein n=1 Tax=Protopterus annectens TaxID=7888 RepID=UPI001CF9A3F2|nr:bublin coiled-coil protein [Protopterus annectens]
MSGPNGDPAVSVNVSGEDDLIEAEYAEIDSMLDQINFCLDALEEKSDVLNAKLRELLESNRQARLLFQQQHLDMVPAQEDPKAS